MINFDKKYYNFNRLFSLKDVNGETPSVYIVTINRNAGKTTGMLATLLSEYFEKGEEFVLLFRDKLETEDAHLLFGDVCDIYFPEIEVESESQAGGLIYTLFYVDKQNERHDMGYALCLKKADKLKKYSPVFRKVMTIVLDEYQLEDEKYLKNETRLLESLVTTISRGGGNLTRNTRTVLLGNPFSPMNPYYTKYDIWKRLRPDTKVLKGVKWVADFRLNKEAMQALAESAHAQAFNSDYTQYAMKGSYLNDHSDFIKKPKGQKILLYYFYGGKKYTAVYRIRNSIFVEAVETLNYDYPVYTFHQDEVIENVQYVRKTKPVYKFLVESFHKNNLFFKDMKSKENFFENVLQ